MTTWAQLGGSWATSGGQWSTFGQGGPVTWQTKGGTWAAWRGSWAGQPVNPIGIAANLRASGVLSAAPPRADRQLLAGLFGSSTLAGAARARRQVEADIAAAAAVSAVLARKRFVRAALAASSQLTAPAPSLLRNLSAWLDGAAQLDGGELTATRYAEADLAGGSTLDGRMRLDGFMSSPIVVSGLVVARPTITRRMLADTVAAADTQIRLRGGRVMLSADLAGSSELDARLARWHYVEAVLAAFGFFAPGTPRGVRSARQAASETEVGLPW